MKTVTKITYGILVAGMALAVGCGDSQEAKKAQADSIAPTAQAAPGSDPANTLMMVNGVDTIPYHELLTDVQTGEYAGVGVESIEAASGNGGQIYPTEVRWYARVEFLTDDGEAKVDPKSFHHPYAERSWVRMILESDARPGFRYVAKGILSFKYETGSVRGGHLYLTGYDAQGAPLFDILFENQYGMPIHLQLIDGRIFSGAILLREASGDHFIVF